MGVHFIDKYSYLHFVVGATIFYWNISLFHWVLIHTLFEIVENSKFGIHAINTYFKFWPGGKPKADTLINNLGDTLFAILGWLSALLVTSYGEKYKMYF
jgi:hypothetical protein